MMILAPLSLMNGIYAQSDTILVDEMEYPTIIEEATEVEAESEFEAVPVEPDFDFNEGFKYEKPRPKKYDFQTRFGLGSVSLNNALSAVEPGGTAIGRYLPSAKFLTSNISNFEISLGKNLSQGLYRFWFGVGIENEYFTFEDASVRLSTRSDSFSHYSVDPNGIPQFGKDENTKSSSLNYTTISVPLAIGFQDKQRRPSYKIQVGAYLGYRFQTKSEIKYEDNTTVTIKGDFHMNPIIVDPYVSIQFKKFGFFGRTSLMPLLKNVGLGNEQTRNAFGLFIGV